MKLIKPIDKFVQSRLDDNFYTPDMASLYRTKWHPLFVYGTLKQGFCRHTALKNCPFIGTAWSRNTGWCMYRTNNANSYPIVFSPQDETPGSIFGEVYLVPPFIIKTLDLIESNGIQYSRVYRTVDIHNRKLGPRTMAVWMYLSERSVWKDAIAKKGIVPCEVFKRKDDPKFKYYLFKKEFDTNASLRSM